MRLNVLTLLFLFITSLCLGQQGLKGKVVWSEGNQMPGPGSPVKTPKGIVREVYIYQVTKQSQVIQKDGFFSNVSTQLVKKVKTNKNGEFSVKLAPGTYSVFVKEKHGLWANLFTSEGFINPVIISPGNWAEITIDVNYEAAY